MLIDFFCKVLELKLALNVVFFRFCARANGQIIWIYEKEYPSFSFSKVGKQIVQLKV